ncbi:AMP-binding protein [Streptomyces natalensis]|uniref:AMP-binding protein n=1 Tax=Streptomyces natalensis TaxID=68242 RepID=UPI00099D0A34|nr:class I adenylate-forming enzyme family protein [Streptomyces natalensis]
MTRYLIESGCYWDWSEVSRRTEELAADARHGDERFLTVTPASGFDVVVALVAGFTLECELVIQPPPPYHSQLPDRSVGPGVWIYTSGTTGSPKSVHWPWRRLFPLKHNEVGDIKRWGIGYAPASFAGVSAICQALSSSASVEFLTPAWPSTRTDRHPLTIAVGTPTFWRMACVHAFRGYKEPAKIDVISMGGEPVDDTLLSAVRNTFHPHRIKQIFGATELGAGIHIDDERGGLPLDAAGQRQSSGAAFDVLADRLLLSPSVGLPYVETGDFVEIVGDRVFVTGRRGLSINVGGTKVSPQAVERVLQEHPSVLAARAYAWRSPVVGSVVAADVVLVPGKTEDCRRDLRAFAEAHLAPAELPRRIRIVEEFVSSAAGKVLRS